jgi:hypothetical protein
MEKYLKKLPIDVYIYQGPAIRLLPEHRMQTITTEWLRANGKDMSFNGLTDDIKHESAIAPITFEYKHSRMNAIWDDGVKFYDDDEEQHHIQEDDFYELWDTIRNEGIISVDNRNESELLAMALLGHLGYMSSIKYVELGANKPSEGYQINMGLNRAFSISKVA